MDIDGYECGYGFVSGKFPDGAGFRFCHLLFFQHLIHGYADIYTNFAD